MSELPGDGKEETLIYYDAEAKQLVFDSTHSGNGGRKAVERAPLELKKGEPLTLRVFVDKSIVEVYANDRQAIGRHSLPRRTIASARRFSPTAAKRRSRR